MSQAEWCNHCIFNAAVKKWECWPEKSHFGFVVSDEWNNCPCCGKPRPAEKVEEDGLPEIFDKHRNKYKNGGDWQDAIMWDLRKWAQGLVDKADKECLERHKLYPEPVEISPDSCGFCGQICGHKETCESWKPVKIPSDQAGASEQCKVCTCSSWEPGNDLSAYRPSANTRCVKCGNLIVRPEDKKEPAKDGQEKAGKELWEALAKGLCRGHVVRDCCIPKMAQAALHWFEENHKCK